MTEKQKAELAEDLYGLLRMLENIAEKHGSDHISIFCIKKEDGTLTTNASDLDHGIDIGWRYGERYANLKRVPTRAGKLGYSGN